MKHLILGTVLLSLTLSPFSPLHAQELTAPQGHWATPSITALVQRGILQPPTTPKKPTRAPKANKLAGDAPVTRYEMVVTLWRFVQYMEAADKQKKGTLKVEMKPEEAIKLLVSGGYLPKDSPLVVGKSNTVTIKQFTKAMSLVISRIQEKKTPISPDAEGADPKTNPDIN
jgi:hypothetical protein